MIIVLDGEERNGRSMNISRSSSWRNGVKEEEGCSACDVYHGVLLENYDP